MSVTLYVCHLNSNLLIFNFVLHYCFNSNIIFRYEFLRYHEAGAILLDLFEENSGELKHENSLPGGEVEHIEVSYHESDSKQEIDIDKEFDMDCEFSISR